MSEPIIIVDGVSKRYVIGQQRDTRDGLRHRFEDAIRSPFRWAKNRRAQRAAINQDFWALKDVSFNVQPGEVLGIIGRNGAGKSTLLKVLSRITEPTAGRIHLKGRVASLLEVGTGFHQELTGRENIFLNGAILGMARGEIRRKFDEIVAFSEIEQFLDTPVKRYSSGMYVRLAFAVAAHLEPEILIVDEVLAVGDAEFQRKCLGKMEEVAHKGGRTVLFVSHQMAAVSNLCTQCVVMGSGRVLFRGATDDAIGAYLAGSDRKEGETRLVDHRASWAKMYITEAQVLSIERRPQKSFAMGSGLIIQLAYKTSDSQPLRRPVMGFAIKHRISGVIAAVNMRMTGFVVQAASESMVLECLVERLPLIYGQYTIDLWLGDGADDVDMLSDYLRFDVEETDIYGTGQTPFSNFGSLFLMPAWSAYCNE